ncbi:MAG: YfcE family phosphodiesterase [Ruminococcus sp.]|nr:metallophosphoesterase [Oscillospiraceae bacterium]
MRIVVMSDTHRCFSGLDKIIQRNPDADLYIHLGDGDDDVDRAILKYPSIAPKIFHVAGNCDSGSMSQSELILTLEGGHKLIAAHGHQYGVKMTLGGIKRAASEYGCDIILYGHTHVRYNSYEDGFYILNPGSASCPHDGNKPSFGLIDVSENGVVMNIADI